MKWLIQIEFFMIKDTFTNIFTKIFTITRHQTVFSANKKEGAIFKKILGGKTYW